MSTPVHVARLERRHLADILEWSLCQPNTITEVEPTCCTAEILEAGKAHVLMRSFHWIVGLDSPIGVRRVAAAGIVICGCVGGSQRSRREDA